MWLLAVSFNDLLLPAALGLLTFFLLRQSVRRFSDLRKRRQQRQQQRPPLRIAPEPTLPTAAGVAGEVELHDRARELMARIDSKAAALEHLLRRAAMETERLEQALRRAEAHADERSPRNPDNR
jgi:hypothetical protein